MFAAECFLVTSPWEFNNADEVSCALIAITKEYVSQLEEHSCTIGPTGSAVVLATAVAAAVQVIGVAWRQQCRGYIFTVVAVPTVAMASLACPSPCDRSFGHESHV